MARLILFFMVLMFSQSLFAAEIDGVRMGAHPDKSRLVIDLTGDVNFSVKIDDNPKRLTIYLPLKRWKVPERLVLAEPFKSIAHTSTQDNITRLTVPLSAPYVIRSAFMISGHNNNGNRLVIDMVPATEIEFLSQLTNKHGPLKIMLHNSGLDNLFAGVAVKDKPVIVAETKLLKKPIVVLDPGHGGKDPGANSPRGIKEKDITISMAKTIARVLNQSGRYDARLTRTDDRYIKLYNRVKIARNADADIFVSIHADSVGNNTTRGASVYTLSNTASDAQTAKLAARENRADLIGGIDLNIEDEDVSAILIDLSMRETMNQSKILANTIVSGLGKSGVKTLKGPHRYAGFAVLKAPDIPSILIETGFVSNEKEAQNLLNPSYQANIGRALLKSLDKYFGNNGG